MSKFNKYRNHKHLLLQAVKSNFFSKKLAAQTNLANYLNNPAGIGEHGDLVSEAVKLVEEIENAESCIEQVDRIIDDLEDSFQDQAKVTSTKAFTDNPFL